MKNYKLYVLLAVLSVVVAACVGQQKISLEVSDRYNSGLGEGSAEIVSYDAVSQHMFVVNAVQTSIDVLKVFADGSMDKVTDIDLSIYKDASASGLSANSVAASHGKFAVALEQSDENDHQLPGKVVVFDANTFAMIKSYPAGFLPDMLTFSKDGKMILVANEGEPSDDYSFDPEGSITRIDLNTQRTTQISFVDFNKGGTKADLIDPSVRIFGQYNGVTATVAQDLEPEYVTISDDNTTAWVSLQENNAFAIVDLGTNQVSKIVSLGFKDYGRNKNAIDSSDKDDALNIVRRDHVVGMYQPDAIASFEAADGKTYIVSANEGDSRDYDGFSEEIRVKNFDNLDPHFAVNAQDDEELGRLKVTGTLGDTNGDGLRDTIFSFGARSFSIWDAQGKQVFDSGNQMIKNVAQELGEQAFLDLDLDKRSDDKGVEPEGVVIGTIGFNTYAFIGLERAGGVMVYDITKPRHAQFVQYMRTDDIAPEGLTFISAAQSPSKQPMLAVSHEVTGTTVLFKINIERTQLKK